MRCLWAAATRSINFAWAILLDASAGRSCTPRVGTSLRAPCDTVNMRGAYQDFLTLWKDADPDIPILKEAKAEYAKLQ